MAFRKRGKKSNIQKIVEEAKAEAKAEKVADDTVVDEQPEKRKKARETEYVCMECGGDLYKYRSSRSHPGFIIRNFKCDNCGRETNQYATKIKTVRL